MAVDGTHVSVKGSKGTLEADFYEKLTIEVEDGVLTVSRPDDERETRARHGLTRALIQNMVIGVSEGYTKVLELAGVGYRVQLKGKDLDLSLGYSQPVIYTAPEGITFESPDNTHIHVKGIDKQQVGQVAAEIRAKRPPEPYKGKGIHYLGEHIRLDLSLGYSHPVIYTAPEGITFECPDNTHIHVKGIDKQQDGQVAAEIRAKRPPEPYKGKGIHYLREHIRRKHGKAAK